MLAHHPERLEGHLTRCRHLGWPLPRTLRRATENLLRARGFAAGSMGPKVEAACRFAERTGGMAAIGSLTEAADVLAGRAGTLVSG